MNRKHIIIAILAASVSVFATAYRPMPSDRHTAEIWISKNTATAISDKDTLDLSAYDFNSVVNRCYECSDDSSFYILERGESAHYTWHGDSLFLVSQGAPGKIFKPVLPAVAAIAGNNSTIQGLCHYEGRIGSSTNMRRYGIWTLHRPEPRTVITPDADTISDCYLLAREEIGVLEMSESPLDTLRVTPSQMFAHNVCSDSIAYALRIDTYFSPSSPYPVLELEEYRLLYYGACVDSVHITKFCTPELSDIADPAQNVLYRRNTAKPAATASTQSLAVTGYEVKPTIFSDRISVIADSDIQPGTNLTITDAGGRMILSQPLNDWQTDINAGSLSSGAYILTITDGDSMMSYKLFKP